MKPMRATAISILILVVICLINVVEGHKAKHYKSVAHTVPLPHGPVYYVPSYYVTAPIYYFAPATFPATSYAAPRISPTFTRSSYSSSAIY